MSSVKIQGSATGTANFTIAVPDGTSTDRTIELPDAAGSFVTADASGDSTVSGTLTVGDGHTIGNDGGDNLKFTSSTGESIVSESASGIHTWRDPSGEFGRFDASGNLLVGKTTAGVDNVGSEMRDGSGDHAIVGTSSSNNVLLLNRTTDDGQIIQLRKDNTLAGVLGSYNNGLYIQGQRNSSNGPLINIRNSTGGTCLTLGVHGTSYGYIGDESGSQVGIAFVSGAIKPVASSDGGVSDNSYDIGTATARWDDIYATSGTVNTSDATEKQQIASLTDAEINAAKAISKLFKTYKWNSSVETKGDAARTHAGVVAQEVEQAMTDAGLDAAKYGFFCSDTWHEDADGNEVEANTEGATERTRLGIRYPELLSFIGAATEQRLASIEARLDALEAV